MQRSIIDSIGGVEMSRKIDIMSNKEKLDHDRNLTCAIISANLPFGVLENPEFIKFITQLRPAYKLPNRKRVS